MNEIEIIKKMKKEFDDYFDILLAGGDNLSYIKTKLGLATSNIMTQIPFAYEQIMLNPYSIKLTSTSDSMKINSAIGLKDSIY